MELDELVIKTEVSKVAETDININQFNRRYNWHFYIEVSVALFAFTAAMIGIFSGHVWYPLVIEQLLPEFVSQQLSMHFLMYFAMACSAIYCLFVPTKLARARALPDVRLACSLKERVESEIQHFETQKKLWTAAHVWSFLPANVIGLSFFWGLQVSLLDQWFPSLYLMVYIGFLVFSNWGGLKLKKQMLEKEVAPILQELYQYRQELSE